MSSVSDALVAVARQEVGAKYGTEERRPPAAGIVAAAGPLELDDVGPEVAEHLPAERPGQERAKRREHAARATVDACRSCP